jgi:protease-4
VLPAAPCNRILAQPGTITGSIGVIFMKLNIKEALAEYGVTGDVVSFGDNADWASGLHALSSKQRQQVSSRAHGSHAQG